MYLPIALSYTSIYARGHLLLTYCVILGDVSILFEILVVESRRNRSLSPARPPSCRGWPSLSSLSSCPGLYPTTRAHLEPRPCSRPSVHPLVRVADQPLGVLLTRLDAVAPPPAAVGAIVGSFAAGTAGWTRLVVRFSRPGQTDGVTQSHTPVVILIVPQGVAQRSFGGVSAHVFVVIETMWPTKSIQQDSTTTKS